MVDPPGLMKIERRQIDESRRLRFVQEGSCHRLQFAPAGPVQLRGVGDPTQQAAPLNDDAVDVPRAKQVRDPAMFVQRILVDGSHDLLRSGAVFGRHAVFQIP